jgi:hypothetical protein
MIGVIVNVTIAGKIYLKCVEHYRSVCFFKKKKYDNMLSDNTTLSENMLSDSM